VTTAHTTELAELKARNGKLLREDVAAGRTHLRGLPEIVAFHTTERCNLRCTMCERSISQGELQLSRDRLAVICDDLFPTARKVALSGAKGEPLLADFDLVAQKALEQDVRIDVVTNGTELDADLYASVAPVLDHVNVSVDAAEPAIYERIRRGARWERLVANLRGIAAHRRRHRDDVLISLSAVVMRSTLPHLEKLIHLAAEMDLTGVILQPLSHAGKPNPDEDPLPELGHDGVRARLEALRPVARAAAVHLFFANFALPPEIVGPLRAKVPEELAHPTACMYVLQHFGVQPDGRVYPCYVPTDHVLGDTNVEAPRSIWNGAAFQRLRAAHYEKRGTAFCSGCVHAPGLPPWRPRWLQTGMQRLRLWRAEQADERRRRRAT
jgi:radical SAM protein with 4Fe4S-binding SPASM domain